jgi:hypothetical protein
VPRGSDDPSEDRTPADGEQEAEEGAGNGDGLDEVGRESFPASDPPASWSGPPADEQDQGGSPRR